MRAPRLFLAIDLDEAVRDFVEEVAARFKARGLKATVQPRDKLHVTIAFLGDVLPEKLGEFVPHLRSAAAACRRFELKLDTVGAFPNLQRARVLWVGCSAAPPLYRDCARAVRSVLSSFGWSFDEESVPHITVCRVKRPHHGLVPIEMPAPVQLPVTQIQLYESVPERGKTRYVARETMPLAR